jgi:DNA polymerase-3 subunit delta
MKIEGDRLGAHLRKGVAPLYVLSSDEPLLVDEAMEQLRESARAAGCGERECYVTDRSFDWEGFAAGLQNMSLFSSRRLVELRLPSGKPGDVGSRVLTELAGNPDTGNVIVVLLPDLDSQTKRSKWVSALAEAAVWVTAEPPSRANLPGWLRSRLAKAGLSADDEALDLLAARVEGNLLAAKQEIDKLALLTDGSRLSAAAVRDAVADGARFDVFQFADAALSGDVARTVRVLHTLEREGEPEALVLWSLTRAVLDVADIVMRVERRESLDQAMEAARVWRSRKALMSSAVRGRSLADVMRLVSCAARAERVVKGARSGQPWNALLEVALELARAPSCHAETA